MQQKLIARTAKLLTETKKGRRKGVAITYEHIPKDIEERNHGSIFAVINVNGPTQEAQEIIELIIDAFHGEYYQDLNREPLLSLEAALSKINEELADVTHQGNVSWLNNLNAILGVLTGTTLHITKAGKTEAYLYRGERQSHISEDLGGDVVNPLRTFINIASGELSEGDKIAIATPGTFFHLSKNELQKYVQGFQPRVAISHVADLLEGTSTEVNPNALLIIEAITPEAASNETIEEQPDEVWISEPAKPLQNALEGASPFLIKVFDFFKLAGLGIVAFTVEQILPQVQKVLPKAEKMIKKAQARTAKAEERILAETEESLKVGQPETITTLQPEMKVEDLEDLTINDSTELIGKEEPAKKSRSNEIFIKEESPKRNWVKLEKVTFPRFGNLGPRVRRNTRKLLANKRALMALVIVIALLFAGGLFMNYRANSGGKTVKVTESSLAEAKSRYEAGQNALSEGDKSKAASILTEAKRLAEGLVNDNKVGTEAKSLLANIQQALDQAEGITRVDPAVFADVTEIAGQDALGPYLIGTNLYLINRTNGSIAEVNTKTGEVANVLDNAETGKIVAASAVVKRSVLVMEDEESNFYEFDTKEATIKQMDMAGEIEQVIAMTSFSTNIYTLTESGKIYKRLKTSTGYARRSEYITDGTVVAGGVSIATDSNMYVLSPNGNLEKFLSGKKQSFSLDLPFALTTANSVYTNEDLNNLYITEKDAGRVVIVNNQGTLQKQLVSDKFNGVSGTAAGAVNVYIFAKGKVYKQS